MLKPEEVMVPNLGPREQSSPLWAHTDPGNGHGRFVSDNDGVPLQVEVRQHRLEPAEVIFEKAGPRKKIYFDPSRTKAAIVTCGGLCPGLNKVIRSTFFELYHGYGVRDVLGIRFGYQGMSPAATHEPIPLTHSLVSDIHKQGGTILGSSRGPVDPKLQVDFLEARRINVLFCIGGDGTQRGALAIHKEAQRRGYPLAVVGIPKTIDNDIQYVWRTFGYFTALDRARSVIESAHNEARSAVNGIGLVKLMGRHAGFVAAGAALASGEVNFTLIPEVPFALDGPDGFLAVLKRRMLDRGHAVVVVAEGAGQYLFDTAEAERDASGNLKLQDIGVYLKDRINEYFYAEKLPVNLKYIDPSYAIRSCPANTEDALLCDQYARHAVHAAMAGKSAIVIGLWYNVFIHVPIAVAVKEPRHVDPHGELWTSVLAATGQPATFGIPIPEPKTEAEKSMVEL
ncbi:MAG: ATP-dependent 6-phosphofructokinase [Bryobacteraceae bacterium]